MIEEFHVAKPLILHQSLDLDSDLLAAAVGAQIRRWRMVGPASTAWQRIPRRQVQRPVGGRKRRSHSQERPQVADISWRRISRGFLAQLAEVPLTRYPVKTGSELHDARESCGTPERPKRVIEQPAAASLDLPLQVVAAEESLQRPERPSAELAVVEAVSPELPRQRRSACINVMPRCRVSLQGSQMNLRSDPERERTCVRPGRSGSSRSARSAAKRG
jgi:hypothetical protein